jgi:hypothetical protein
MIRNIDPAIDVEVARHDEESALYQIEQNQDAAAGRLGDLLDLLAEQIDDPEALTAAQEAVGDVWSRVEGNVKLAKHLLGVIGGLMAAGQELAWQRDTMANEIQHVSRREKKLAHQQIANNIGIEMDISAAEAERILEALQGTSDHYVSSYTIGDVFNALLQLNDAINEEIALMADEDAYEEEYE